MRLFAWNCPRKGVGLAEPEGRGVNLGSVSAESTSEPTRTVERILAGIYQSVSPFARRLALCSIREPISAPSPCILQAPCQGLVDSVAGAVLFSLSRLYGREPSGIFIRVMIDIHCHILPGLDDGPDSLDEALQMAEMAIADGITHVVATPHANDRYRFSPDLVHQRRNEIQARLGDRLALTTGCDFHLSFENLQDLHAHPSKYTINQKNYLLVEFADFALPPNIDETLHRLQLARLSPIITHPERNGLIRAQPEQIGRAHV